MSYTLPTSETVINTSVETILWQADEVTDENGNFTGELWDEIHDTVSVHHTTLTQILIDVYTFIARVSEDDIDLYLTSYDWGQFIHDYWMTRNHHGTGFWDRGLGTLGERLTILAQDDSEYSLWQSTEDIRYLMQEDVTWLYG